MDGGDRAGYKQISKAVDATLIGPSTGSTTYTSGDWSMIQVVSSKAVFAGITAPGMTNSSKISSATSWDKGVEIGCSKITAIKLSSKTTDHAVLAYNRILL
jgi:hypothetical protein